MAIFSFNCRMVCGSKGQSPVKKATYIGGRKLFDKKNQKKFDYTKKSKEVVYSKIMAPELSPSWVYNPEKLWNAVEAREKRKDAQFARELIIAFPIEFNLNQQVKLIENYITKHFVQKGMIADINIHHTAGNPHVHVLLTTRKLLSDENFGNKERIWNGKETLNIWRTAWEKECNDSFKIYEINANIRNESYKTRKIAKIQTLHIGNDKNRHIKKEINAIILKINNLMEKKNNKNLFFQQTHLVEDLEKLTSKIENNLSKQRLMSYKKITELMESINQIYQRMLDKNKYQALKNKQENVENFIHTSS